MKIYVICLVGFFLLFGFTLKEEESVSQFNTTQNCNCDPVRDSLVLIDLYNATDGENWVSKKGWNQVGVPLKKWTGVNVNPEGCVKNLNIGFHGQQGELPSSLGNLLCLEHLSIIGSFKSNRTITGEFPESIALLPNLKSLKLSGPSADFNNTIPMPVGGWPALRKIFLMKQNLVEELSVLFKMSQLEDLFVAGLKKEKEFPEGICNLKKLKNFALVDSSIEGVLPEDFGCLESLEVFGVSGCWITGAIPESLFGLQKLKEISFSSCKLDQPISPAIGKCKNLEHFSLHTTSIFGPIPSTIGQCKKLKYLQLDGNQIGGPIPKEIGQLPELIELRLLGNQITGKIPEQIGNLKKLETLWLSNNENLTGTLPKSIGEMESLKQLWAGGCNLHGSIPKELAKLPNIKEVSLDDNNLSGDIPVELLSHPRLQNLSLMKNAYTGCFPKELWEHCRSNRINLNNNPGLPFKGNLKKWCEAVEQIGAPCDDLNDETTEDIIREDCMCRGE